MVGEAKNSIEIIASLASAGVEAKADQKWWPYELGWGVVPPSSRGCNCCEYIHLEIEGRGRTKDCAKEN